MMNFFVNVDLSNPSSGIEHSEIKRLRLFQKYHQPAKIVTTFYRNNWAAGPGKFGVDVQDVINIFDYLGENENDFYQKNTIVEYCQKNHYLQTRFLGQEKDELGYLVTTSDGRQALVRASADTKQVLSVAFAPLGSKTPNYGEAYDTRGFLSAKYYYDQKGHVKKQEVINTQGKTFCTQVFKDEKHVALYKLNFRGHKYNFQDLRNFQAFFFDHLNQDYGENNLFISDRYECNEALCRMQTAARKGVYIHNQFGSDPRGNPLTGGLNYNYSFALEHADLFDFLICPSRTEKSEINQRFHLGDKVRAIPGGFAQTEISQVPLTHRDRYRIMMVARISSEKQLSQAIQILQLVRKTLPQAHLDIFGGITEIKEYDRIKGLIAVNNLRHAVKLCGVKSDLNAEYDRAALLLLTSISEGFPLTFLEAVSHGLPLVAYDCRYGPRDIIQDGSNGYLIQQDAPEEAAQKIIKIMSDSSLQENLCQGSYQTAVQFDAQHIWQLWQNII